LRKTRGSRRSTRTPAESDYGGVANQAVAFIGLVAHSHERPAESGPGCGSAGGCGAAAAPRARQMG